MGEVYNINTGKVLRYPPEASDRATENWWKRVNKQIDRQLDLLYTYGDDYVNYMAWREGRGGN